MDLILLVSRNTLGLIFFLAGINGFLNLVSGFGIVSDNFSIEQSNLIISLVQAKFVIPLLNLTEILAGALLLVSVFVPFAALILVPVTLNIFLFHYFLGTDQTLIHKEMILPSLIVFLHILLLITQIKKYNKLFSLSLKAKSLEEK